ncbi:MAG: hypothetical protein FJ221_03435 [Lentisphaerae bacterium]|nr:hypothetical protein [Lentisphaerota bacterium]
MNCESARFEIATAETETRSAALAAHLERCPPCRAYAARDASVRNLLAFKRNETPDAHFETRLVARVRGEIEGTVPTRRWVPAAAIEWFTPAVRWAVASAAIVVAAVGFLRPGAVPVPVPGLASEAPTAQPISMFADSRAPTLMTSAVPLLAVMTNQGPPMLRLSPGGPVEYGTGGTVPVGLQY